LDNIKIPSLRKRLFLGKDLKKDFRKHIITLSLFKLKEYNRAKDRR
jgi:hypothetical protein